MTHTTKSQIVLYMIFGLVIFLIFLGLTNLVLHLFTVQKALSAQDVTSYINNCLNIGLTCSLYTAGLHEQQHTIDEAHQQTTQDTENALKQCLGDLSQKFKGNKFSFTNTQPSILFGDETTSATLQNLGEMQNGNTRKTLEGYATQTPIAFSKLHTIIQTLLLNKGREQKIQTLDPRYALNVYQLDNGKEAVILSDAQSRLNEKAYQTFFVN